MTDQAIAAQLNALVDDYERRAEKASPQAKQRLNFNRMSTRASEGIELCQRT